MEWVGKITRDFKANTSLDRQSTWQEEVPHLNWDLPGTVITDGRKPVASSSGLASHPLRIFHVTELDHY